MKYIFISFPSLFAISLFSINTLWIFYAEQVSLYVEEIHFYGFIKKNNITEKSNKKEI